MSNANFQPCYGLYTSDPQEESELLHYRGQSVSFNYIYRLACHNKRMHPSHYVAIKYWKIGPVEPDPIRFELAELLLLVMDFELAAVAELLSTGTLETVNAGIEPPQVPGEVEPSDVPF